MSHFEIGHTVVPLELAQPFTISRGTKRIVENVFVKIVSEGVEGLGEAAPNKRYNEDASKVVGYINAIPRGFFDEIGSPEELLLKLRDFSGTPQQVQSARAALEMAWLDWWGKSQNKSLAELLNAPTRTGPPTSYTIGLDEIDIMQQKVAAAPSYPIYKVKLGTDRDRAIIRGIREVTDKPIYVDANEGWQDVEEAKAYIGFLADNGVRLIEQPMPAGRFEDLKKLKAYAPVPLCADESFEGHESLERISQAFDMINIKLMKTGSILESLQIIEEARELGLKVMIGCMIESSLANTAGALLSLWADHADLDGHLLIAGDPAKGLTLDKKKSVQMPAGPGLGVDLKLGF